MNRLDDKTAVITDGAHDLGAAAAGFFIAVGAHILIIEVVVYGAVARA